MAAVTMATAVVSLGRRALGLAVRRARLLPGASPGLEQASARALSLRNSRPRRGNREEGGRTCSRPDPPQPLWAGPGRPQSCDSALDHLAGIAPGEAAPSAPPAPAFPGRPRAWEGATRVRKGVPDEDASGLPGPSSCRWSST